jgi:predicted P-loop ATPase
MTIDSSHIEAKRILQNLGIRFKDNKCSCIFHSEKTPSMHVTNNKFYCFGCNEGGDVIKLVMKLNNCDFIEAVKYLGLEDQLSSSSKAHYENKKAKEDRLIKAKEAYNSASLIKDVKKVYSYENERGGIAYFQARGEDENGNKKFLPAHYDVNGNIQFNLKSTTYDSLADRLVENPIQRIPYNLQEVTRALTDKRAIVITEGEKDAETIISFGYIATSLKGVKLKEYDFAAWKGAAVYFCGDTGKAGEKHREDVWEALKEVVEHFYVVELPGFEKLGDNKDVTDWVENQANADLMYREIKLSFDSRSIWDWKKSREWRDMLPKSSGRDYYPSPMSINNVNCFLKSISTNLEREEVSGAYKVGGIPRQFLEKDDTICVTYMVSEMWNAGCKIKNQVVEDAIEYISERNSYNLFQNICKENRNKKHHLIDNLVDLLNLETELEKKLTKKWLFSYVNQGFNSFENMFVMQGVLVIAGMQGLGKSSFVKELALNDDRLYRSSDGLDFYNTDSIKKHTGRNLVELTEILLNTKHEVEGFKNFLDKYADAYRKLYKNGISNKLRFTAFVATTNETSFLKDPTGSRRFWVIRPQNFTSTTISENGIQIKEVLGAIYDILADKTIRERMAFCGLTSEEIKEVNAFNASFYSGGNVGQIIRSMFDLTSEPKHFISRRRLFEILGEKGLSEKDHALAVKNFLQSQGVVVEDKNGNTMQRKIKGINERGFMLWDRIFEESIQEANYQEEALEIDRVEKVDKEELINDTIFAGSICDKDGIPQSIRTEDKKLHKIVRNYHEILYELEGIKGGFGKCKDGMKWVPKSTVDMLKNASDKQTFIDQFNGIFATM